MGTLPVPAEVVSPASSPGKGLAREAVPSFTSFRNKQPRNRKEEKAIHPALSEPGNRGGSVRENKREM